MNNMEENPQQRMKISLPGALILGAALVSLVLVLNGIGSDDLGPLGQAKISIVNTDVDSTPDPNVKVNVDIGDDPVLGSPDAPVTVIEFSDYQCPYCRAFWTDWLPQLKEKYIDEGLVKLVFKDFPLDSIHPFAYEYALAANCANDQSKYWEMHDRIFEEQSKFGTGTVSHITIDDLKQWAIDLGLNPGQFNECLDKEEYNNEIYEDLSYGSQLGARGTPTFFVNGTIVPGLLNSFAAFEVLIKEELQLLNGS